MPWALLPKYSSRLTRATRSSRGNEPRLCPLAPPRSLRSYSKPFPYSSFGDSMPSSTPTERASNATNTLITRITELVQACFTGLYIETHEPEEAVRDLTQLCRSESWRLSIWDCDGGLRFPCEEVPVPGNPNELADPLAVLRTSSQLSMGPARRSWCSRTSISFSAASRFFRLSPGRCLAVNIAGRSSSSWPRLSRHRPRSRSSSSWSSMIYPAMTSSVRSPSV